MSGMDESLRIWFRRLDLAAAMAGLPGDIVGTAQTTAGSTTHLINAFAAHFAEVEVDTWTGDWRFIRAVYPHDTGLVINPLVAETNDGYLNDIRGRHVGPA